MFTVRANPIMLIMACIVVIISNDADSMQLLRQMTNVSTLSVSSDVLVAGCQLASFSCIRSQWPGARPRPSSERPSRALRNPSTAWPRVAPSPHNTHVLSALCALTRTRPGPVLQGLSFTFYRPSLEIVEPKKLQILKRWTNTMNSRF